MVMHEPAVAVEGRLAFVGNVAVRVWPATKGDVARAPVIVACHGWTDGADIYATLVPWLRGQCTLVALDAPGHGLSPWVPEPRYSFDTYADSIASVVDALPHLVGPHGDLILLGHSLGAIAAARVAARRPAVARLLMEEPARRPLRGRRERRKDFNWVVRLQATDHDGRVEAAASLVNWSQADLDMWARTKEQLDVTCTAVRPRWGELLTTTLKDVQCPATLLLGRGRLWTVSGRRARKIARSGGSDIRIVRLPAGHSPRRDSPEAFAQALWVELDELRCGGRAARQD